MEMLASQPPGSAAAGRRASRVRRCRRPVAGRARCHGYPNPECELVALHGDKKRYDPPMTNMRMRRAGPSCLLDAVTSRTAGGAAARRHVLALSTPGTLFRCPREVFSRG